VVWHYTSNQHFYALTLEPTSHGFGGPATPCRNCCSVRTLSVATKSA
jgi:hypothetical protein